MEVFLKATKKFKKEEETMQPDAFKEFVINKLIEYIRFSIDNGTFIEYKKNFYERYFNE